MITSFQIDGVSIGSLDDIPGDAVSTFFKSIRNTLDFDFDDDNEGQFPFPLFLRGKKFLLDNIESMERRKRVLELSTNEEYEKITKRCPSIYPNILSKINHGHNNTR